MSRLLLVAGALFVINLPSCATEPRRYPSPLSGLFSVHGYTHWDHPAGVVPGPILLISDTHISNPLNPHATLTGGEWADYNGGRSAIRPPQMEAWGWKTLNWILETERKAVPDEIVIHLGDALNVGCHQEFEIFRTVMDHTHKGRWVMTPGNHDTTAYGNWLFMTGSENKLGSWSGECAAYLRDQGMHNWGAKPGQLFHKVSFVDAYLAAQGWSPLPRRTNVADKNDCYDITPIGSVVRRVRICRNESKAPYTGYLLQELDYPGRDDLSIILVDTTNFREFPPPNGSRLFLRKLVDKAGIYPAPLTAGQQGGIRPAQLKVLRRWLDEDRAQGKRVVLMSHYPMDALDEKSLSDLQALLKDSDVVAYIGAHTHDETSLRQHHDGLTTFGEINIGSTLDWPMQYHRLAITSYRPDSYVFDLRVRALREAWACPVLEKLDKRSPAYYLKYRDDKCHGYFSCIIKAPGRHYMDVRHAMYDDLKFHFSSFAQGEDELLSGTPSFSEPRDLVEYERCQVRWASAAESETPAGVGADPVYISQLLASGYWQLEFRAKSHHVMSISASHR